MFKGQRIISTKIKNRGVDMFKDRILLTSKEILEKNFKVDTRGYRPQEVDKFLDAVIRDYDEFFEIIKDIESEKKDLIEEVIKLKSEIRNLKNNMEVIGNSKSEVSNSDLLRRLSNLEKEIYNKD